MNMNTNNSNANNMNMNNVNMVKNENANDANGSDSTPIRRQYHSFHGSGQQQQQTQGNNDEHQYTTTQHTTTQQQGGMLNRGGAFPTRYGRHIYTGSSSRTLSSMSSIGEGDQLSPTSSPPPMVVHQYQYQQRALGRSCRTLGSLSTIDGANEDDDDDDDDQDEEEMSYYSLGNTTTATATTTCTTNNNNNNIGPSLGLGHVDAVSDQVEVEVEVEDDRDRDHRDSVSVSVSASTSASVNNEQVKVEGVEAYVVKTTQSSSSEVVEPAGIKTTAISPTTPYAAPTREETTIASSTVNVNVNVNVNVINNDNDNECRQQRQEEKKDNDNGSGSDVVNHLEYLQDSMKSSSSSSPDKMIIKALESLSDFIASFFDPGSKLELLIEKGVIEVIVAAMGRYSESAQVQAKACEVLTSFASYDDHDHDNDNDNVNNNENNNDNNFINSNNNKSSSTQLRRRQIMDKGRTGEAILFSSMILHEDNPGVQEAALTAIQYLCADCEGNQTDFLKLDVIEPIIRAMENHRNEPRLQETGASVISILAANNNDDVKSAIGVNGGVPVILRAIFVHLDDVGVVEWCSRALFTLTLEDPDNVLVFLKIPEATNAVINAMQSHTDTLVVQEIGCAILANLTMEAGHVDLIIDNNAAAEEEALRIIIETIIEAIQAHANSPTVQESGCAALVNLTDSDETKMFVVDMGALDAIILAMVLHKDDVRVQERVVFLLLLLAIKENHQHIMAANPIELVKTAAYNFPDQCQEHASQLIQQLGL